jgi:hypothetical protein
MGTTAISGPQIVYGPNALEDNQPAPSQFAWGTAFFDARFPYSGANTSVPQAYGFPQQAMIQALDFFVYPLGTIAASQTTTEGVPLVLTTTAEPGITPSQNMRIRSTGQIIPNLIVLDDFHINNAYEIPVACSYLMTDNFGIWDPTTLSSRHLVFSGTSNDTSFQINGIDVYGYPVSETLVWNSSSVTTSKAYKAIISIIPLSTATQDVQVKTSIVIGLPIRNDDNGHIMVYESGNFVASPTIRSSLYGITGITSASGILTITIAVDVVSSANHTLPVGSTVTITQCNPSSFNGTYTVLSSAPGTFTVASQDTDTYVSGGEIFCSESSLLTADVRGSYGPSSVSIYASVYQSISTQNMLSNVGQFGVAQFGM